MQKKEQLQETRKKTILNELDKLIEKKMKGAELSLVKKTVEEYKKTLEELPDKENLDITLDFQKIKYLHTLDLQNLNSSDYQMLKDVNETYDRRETYSNTIKSNSKQQYNKKENLIKAFGNKLKQEININDIYEEYKNTCLTPYKKLVHEIFVNNESRFHEQLQNHIKKAQENLSITLNALTQPYSIDQKVILKLQEIITKSTKLARVIFEDGPAIVYKDENGSIFICDECALFLYLCVTNEGERCLEDLDDQILSYDDVRLKYLFNTSTTNISFNYEPNGEISRESIEELISYMHIMGSCLVFNNSDEIIGMVILNNLNKAAIMNFASSIEEAKKIFDAFAKDEITNSGCFIAKTSSSISKPKLSYVEKEEQKREQNTKEEECRIF